MYAYAIFRRPLRVQEAPGSLRTGERDPGTKAGRDQGRQSRTGRQAGRQAENIEKYYHVDSSLETSPPHTLTRNSHTPGDLSRSKLSHAR